MKCIAIDDEPLALDLLEDNISMVPYLQLVGKCSNAFEAIAILQQQEVDLIFLDIQMPGLTGLQFLQSLAHKPLVILITAYEKYALEGFNLDVTDYLVKPVSLERFFKACNKARELYQLKNNHKPSATHPDFFFVNVDYSLQKIVFADILWIEGLKDYVRIHLRNNPKPVITRISFKSLEEQLQPGKFIRIHKSYIVAIAAITAIRKNSIFLDTIELPVGDTYRDSVYAITGKTNL
ncbi:two component transcriptional regulator, LytTR family [Chitinophaga terrae (ex Kim and Jung 2007)]|uniref:Two component transcriptional regulator, LytTR family n=1 Tax=Chitinophaga terrae (ex Kim and Jung 2007) TaxID=408074 RepID=A0A1H3XDX1_9BACT|nr:response regulator transcription factor [Chitinophaga terrae (ex Kim and Jung 2007)]MDQ0108887.1 DNA-binding LytR/AlgR family response regulator [Chitinophaga terrae (ex Kim and Jung 2007)]GEP89795.1 DNA-binding response regulator [Chitinophaga terrae (ex Kim and Jung 2007)]SDZ97151.1 two component transcriptional regulator, LytTR family [Chitinophaga terrae (ex Kim and Jung 2007)]